MLIRNNQNDDIGDRLTWKIVNGQSTSLAEFSDPRADAWYTLCIYAGTGQAQVLIQEMSIAPRPFDWAQPPNGWYSPPNSRGFNYQDPPALQGGAYRIRLRPSDQNRTRILVRGRGVNLGDPLYSAPRRRPADQPAHRHLLAGTFRYPKQNDANGFRAIR